MQGPVTLVVAFGQPPAAIAHKKMQATTSGGANKRHIKPRSETVTGNCPEALTLTAHRQ